MMLVVLNLDRRLSWLGSIRDSFLHLYLIDYTGDDDCDVANVETFNLAGLVMDLSNDVLVD
jgi:hypothetical protein